MWFVSLLVFTVDFFQHFAELQSKDALQTFWENVISLNSDITNKLEV